MYVINIATVRDAVVRRSCTDGRSIDLSQITDVEKFLNTKAHDMGINAVGHRPMAWHVIWLLKEHLGMAKDYDAPLTQQAYNLLDDLFTVQSDNTLFPEQMMRVLRMLTKAGWIKKDRRRRTLTILPEDLAKAERLRQKPGYLPSKCCVVACAAKRQWKKRIKAGCTVVHVNNRDKWVDTSSAMVGITAAFDDRQPLPSLPVTLTFTKAGR